MIYKTKSIIGTFITTRTNYINTTSSSYLPIDV
jgi:hypothetical protein